MHASWKPRHTLAVVFALVAGAVLSPVAVQAAATMVNIADQTTSTTARVDSGGYLRTGAAQLAPALSFHHASYAFGQSLAPITRPTTARLALTHLQLTNPPANTATTFDLYVVPGNTASQCAGAGSARWLGSVIVASGGTHDVSYDTPLVVKPLQAGQSYCVAVWDNGTADSWAVPVSVTGFVVSGSYPVNAASASAPSSSAPAAGTSSKPTNLVD